MASGDVNAAKAGEQVAPAFVMGGHVKDFLILCGFISAIVLMVGPAFTGR